MNDRLETDPAAPAPAPAPAAGSPAPAPGPAPEPEPEPEPPTAAQRQRLVARLQGQALARPDPLAANLGVLTGDLMLLAHRQADRLRDDPAPDPETFLKMLRQVDRIAQVQARLGGAAGGRG